MALAISSAAASTANGAAQAKQDLLSSAGALCCAQMFGELRNRREGELELEQSGTGKSLKSLSGFVRSDLHRFGSDSPQKSVFVHRPDLTITIPKYLIEVGSPFFLRSRNQTGIRVAEFMECLKCLRCLKSPALTPSRVCELDKWGMASFSY